MRSGTPSSSSRWSCWLVEDLPWISLWRFGIRMGHLHHPVCRAHCRRQSFWWLGRRGCRCWLAAGDNFYWVRWWEEARNTSLSAWPAAAPLALLIYIPANAHPLIDKNVCWGIKMRVWVTWVVSWRVWSCIDRSWCCWWNPHPTNLGSICILYLGLWPRPPDLIDCTPSAACSLHYFWICRLFLWCDLGLQIVYKGGWVACGI